MQQNTGLRLHGHRWSGTYADCLMHVAHKLQQIKLTVQIFACRGKGYQSVEFSSTQLQITPAWKFRIILKTLISWIGCVWLGLELNCAELWPSRNWVWDQWSILYLRYLIFNNNSNKPVKMLLNGVHTQLTVVGQFTCRVDGHFLF